MTFNFGGGNSGGFSFGKKDENKPASSGFSFGTGKLPLIKLDQICLKTILF